MSTVRLGNKLVGDDQPCFVIAEIGINHNGDMGLAKRLISVAVASRLRCGQISEAYGARGVFAERSL